MTGIKYSSTTLKIEGMHCAACQRPIEKALRETEGVTDVSVNLASREVTVESYLGNDKLISIVADAGYEAVLDQVQSLREDDEANRKKFRKLISKTLLALGIGIALMVFTMYAPTIGTEWNLAHAVWLVVAVVTAGVM